MIQKSTYQTIFKQVGSLLILLGFVQFVPLIISLLYSEWFSAIGFLISAGIIGGFGFGLYRRYYQSEEPHYNHFLIIAASGWLGVTAFGGIPFFIISHITPTEVITQFIPPDASYGYSSLQYLRNPLHCFFESMSAFTTTGLTMVVHEPSVGKGVLFYRSFAQWVGGAGFIVMVLAVFKQTSGRSAILLYGSEANGEKLRPRVIDTARAIWKVYLFVTLFSFIYLVIGTYLFLPDYSLADNIFDSINHAMAGQSTGGFSTLDDSIATYNSPYMDMLYLLPMILGALSIPFFYKLIYERKFSEFWNDLQTRALIFVFVVGSIILSFLLFNADVVSNPVREGTFQFVSAMSTTGWQTSSIDQWNWLSIVFIVSTAMYVGGASGATVGGIKMIRALLISKGLIWQINKGFLSEHTVKNIKFNGKMLSPQQMNEEFSKAAALAIIFFLIVLASSIVTFFLTGNSYNYADALFEASSAQGTVGLSTGITHPGMSPVLEIVYIFQMWSGRLEILPVLGLFRAIFWGTLPKTL